MVDLKALCSPADPPEWYALVLSRIFRALIQDGITGDVLEIGLGAGRTHVQLHNAALGTGPRVFGVEYLAEMAKFNAGVDSIVQRVYEIGSIPHIFLMDSATAHTFMQTLRFSLIFIDGDHTYESAARDFACYLPLVVTHGVVAVHDENVQGVARAIEEHKHHFHTSVVFPAPDPKPRTMWCGVTK